MALMSMRKGFFSLLFMALLLIGGFGLVLSDAGGFFRNGVSRTDIATIGSEKISAIEFDRQVRRLLQGQQITPQDAYKAGLINQYLETEISKILIAKEAKNLGIVVSNEIMAEQIKKFIAETPIPVKDPKEAFALLLKQQGLSEREFVEQLRNESSAQLVMKVVSGLAVSDIQPPALLSKTMFKWFTMKRDIDYVELKFADAPTPASPDEKTLSAYYDDIKDEYALPELRDFTVGIFSPQNFKDLNDDQIFEMVNQIDERISNGESLENLKNEFKLTTTPVSSLSATDLPEPLMFLGKDAERLKGIAFETANGETAHLTELANGDMAAVTVTKVSPASFEPLADVKDKVLASYMIKARKDSVIAQANKIIDTINKDKKSLATASQKIVTRQEGLSRASASPKFTMLDIQKIMEPQTGKALMLSDANAVQIIVAVQDHVQNSEPSKEELEQIGKAMKLDFSDEIQNEVLTSLQTKYRVKINTELLNLMYGSQTTTAE